MKVFDTETYIDSLIEIVNTGQEVPLMVVGHSMEPFLIHERDSVLLAPICDSLKKGISLCSNGKMVSIFFIESIK